MSESTSLSHLYRQLSGLPIVFDNARTHAPFQNPYFRPPPLSESSFACGSTSELEHDHDEQEDERQQPPSPARGLTRWGSQEDLISNIVPKQPSRVRSSPDGSPVPWQEPPPPPPPPCIISNASNIRDTRIERIRSRWNSNVGNDEKTCGKISLSPPAIPRRCLDCALVDDIMAPSSSTPDDQSSDEDEDEICGNHNHVKDFTSSIITQAEGKVWKELIRKELMRKNQQKASCHTTNMKRLESPADLRD